MANDPGELPTYEYRPSNSNQPRMRTHSGRRARFTGDTYFRSTEVGQASNRISLLVTEPDGAKAGYLHVVNHNFLSEENVTTPANVKFDFIDISDFGYGDELKLEFVSPTLTRTHPSIKLANSAAFTKSELVPLGATISLPNGALLQLNAEHTSASSGDTVTIRSRVQSYPLKWITVTETSPDGSTQTFSGWDIEDLRTKVTNNPSSWIQMPKRSFKDGVPIQIPPYDAQDEEEDEPVLLPFSSYLGGGDGLPEEPDGQNTGPSRSIVHLNYSEVDDGTMGLANVVYEWRGSSNVDGEWVNLFRS